MFDGRARAPILAHTTPRTKMMRLGSLERVEYVVVDRTGYVELNLAADHNRCGRLCSYFWEETSEQ